ncbi:MAG: dTMP kinase [Rhabdaerophilum calidifontis]
MSGAGEAYPGESRAALRDGGGLFVTFEGGEGAGKSTQIRHLAQALAEAGHRVTLTREPGGTPLAEAIRALLLGPDNAAGDPWTQLLLFAAARRENIRAVIAPALARGEIVLCDRFADSTRAYQGGRLPDAAIETAIALATGGLAPDLTLLLDLPPEAGLARAPARRRGAAGDPFEAADLAFHAAVRSRFLAIAAREPDRVLVFDGTEPEADLAARIGAALATRLAAAAPA